MTNRQNQNSRLSLALEASGNLWARGFAELRNSGDMTALAAHTEIEVRPVGQKSAVFYRHLVPLRIDSVALLAETYRRCFKLALAHPREAGLNPDEWAWGRVQPAVGATLEWIRDWYMLACDGENQYVRHAGSTEWVPGQTVSFPVSLTAPSFGPPEPWRAPAWLFSVSPLLGIGPLKVKHVPANDSEQKLSAAHTRLLLKGARLSFLWQLGAAIENVRNEETAAAGAIPAESVSKERRESKTRQPKGFEALPQKALDLSRYMDNLTEKQRTAFSLKCEYRLPLAEVASRMGLDRKTAYEHIQAATRKIDQFRSGERRKANRAKGTPDE